MKSWKSLLLFFAAVVLAAALGIWARPDAWYAGLNKAWFNPPNTVFAPVWTLLYIAMAFAAWRVYRRCGMDAAIVLWIVQLCLNGAWSPLFFGAHAVSLALLDILALLLAVVATCVLFFRRDRIAGWLMLPYAFWVAFASLLTGAIWRLNPH